jgi:hypothetical protein
LVVHDDGELRHFQREFAPATSNNKENKMKRKTINSGPIRRGAPKASLGGAPQGAVKWTSKFGTVGANPSTASYALHALGLGITVFHSSEGGSISINDFYMGTSPEGFTELGISAGTFSNPVFLDGSRVIVIAGSDNVFRTIIRNPDGSLKIQLVAMPNQVCVSNLTSVDDDTVVYVDVSNQLDGVTIGSDGASLSIAFSQRPQTATIHNAVVQAIDSGHFAFIVPDNAGHSSCYYLTRTTTLRGFTALFATGPFCVAAPYIYCLEDDGSQYLIEQFRLDEPEGFEGWKTYLGVDSVQVSNLLIASNSIYCGYGGNLQSLRLDTGAMSTIQVGGDQYLLNANPIFEEDGILYICIPNGQLYAVDLASGVADTLSYSFNSLPALSQPVGVENGLFVVLTYVDNFFCLAGVDLSSLLHGYTTDSILMAEDTVAGGASGYMPANPGYRTVVHLTDENDMPRANTPIRIEATDTVTITSGGVTTTLTNPGDNVWLTTDPNGDLHMVCGADDIQSPALYLWAAFMDTSEAMVIYPDHVNLNKLTQAKSDDYSKATGFDGTNMVPSNVNPGQLAQTVSGILGAGSVIDPPAGPYSSYGTSPNLVYQPVKGAVGRVMKAGPSATSFTTDINADGSITYNPTSGASPASSQLQGALTLSWDDFKNDVVKAGKKVKQLAITIGSDIEHLITTVDGDIYQFTVDTFEKAAGVVTGLFKTILADFEKAIEWLSALFDWGAIKQIQAQIKSAVTNFQTNVHNYLGQDASTLQSRLTTYFGNAAKAVDQYFTTISNDLGGSTLGSRQPNGGNPQQLYTKPPGQSSGAQPGAYAQSQAMPSKLQDNIRSASKSSSLPNGAASFLSTFTDVLNNQIPAKLSAAGYLDQAKQAAKDIPGAFGPLLSNPGGALKHTFADLLQILGDFAALFLDGTAVAIDVVIGVIVELLDILIDLVTGSMEIPVLGPLFKLIFGTDLTFLDLVSFVIAVPTSIMMKIGGVSSSGGLVGAESGWQLLAFCCSSAVGGFFDALSDTIAETGDDPICIVDICFGLVTWALGAPFSGFNGDSPAIVYFCLGLIPIFISTANAINYWLLDEDPTPEGLAEAKDFADNCYATQGFYGIGGLTYAIFGSVDDPSAFKGNQSATLVGNVFSNSGLISKLFYPNVPKLTIATDALFPAAAAFCSIVANVND